MKILGMTLSQSTYDEITKGNFLQGLKDLRHEMHLELRSARALAEKIRDGEVKPDPEEPAAPVAINTKLAKYPCRAEVEYLLFDLRRLESLPVAKMDDSIVVRTKDLTEMLRYAAEDGRDLFDFKKWGISVHHNLWAMVDGVEVRLQDDRNAIEIELK